MGSIRLAAKLRHLRYGFEPWSGGGGGLLLLSWSPPVCPAFPMFEPVFEPVGDVPFAPVAVPLPVVPFMPLASVPLVFMSPAPLSLALPIVVGVVSVGAGVMAAVGAVLVVSAGVIADWFGVAGVVSALVLAVSAF